jgi:phosphatidate cytidylyltransferase
MLIFSVPLLPTILLSLSLAGKDPRRGLPTATSVIFSIPYVILPFLLLLAFRANANGSFQILFIFCAVWSGDVAAYYVGKNIGKRKLAALISPNKTIEGAIASLLFSSIACVTYVAFVNRFLPDFATGSYHLPMMYASPQMMKPLHVVFFAIAINLAAQLGDLAESMIKRGADVKDSGTLLPGHGGMLDRVDALLFAIPVAALLFFFHPVHAGTY